MEMNEQHKLGVHGFQDIYRTTIISPDNSRIIAGRFSLTFSFQLSRCDHFPQSALPSRIMA